MLAALIFVALSGDPTVLIKDDALWLDRADGSAPVRLTAADERLLCNAITEVHILAAGRIGAECHISPSTGRYYVIDVKAGKIEMNSLGYGFQPSPDLTRVAHGGWMPHFAPAWAHSDHLQIDGKTVYPPKNTDEEPCFRRPGSDLVARGIHMFFSRLTWSVDSRRVAVVERVFDFRLLQAGDDNVGRDENSRFALVVVDLNGKSIRHDLPAIQGSAEVNWIDRRRVAVTAGEYTATFPVE